VTAGAVGVAGAAGVAGAVGGALITIGLPSEGDDNILNVSRRGTKDNSLAHNPDLTEDDEPNDSPSKDDGFEKVDYDY